MPKPYRLERTQRLPIPLDECWKFFSNPQNLPVITPPWLGFEVLDSEPTAIHPGMILRYHVHPMFGRRVTWVTEITHVDEGTFFVDEQRFGPYHFWHHKHYFRPVGIGTEVRDVVDYLLPYGPLGRLAHEWSVRGKLRDIFDYRHRVLQERFDGSGQKSNSTFVTSPRRSRAHA
ncbi:hypothetical protein Pan216_50750 [Planctomycetes bacterium Pan216]|uniref:Coenzyme Q-binding protein COQ10 START domain-containing protein n=1 Tax=Kolteria novifilia TaxID=2527975 RepID=A0A518BB27_9BACT|nr:hypothetical protein Pan216_50750 [Planctomycetes bacterium Pan216]